MEEIKYNANARQSEDILIFVIVFHLFLIMRLMNAIIEQGN